MKDDTFLGRSISVRVRIAWRKQTDIKSIWYLGNAIAAHPALWRDCCGHVVRGCRQRVGMANAVLLHRDNCRHIVWRFLGGGIVTQDECRRVAAHDYWPAPAPSQIDEPFGIDL